MTSRPNPLKPIESRDERLVRDGYAAAFSVMPRT
jgi:hypothetical protein